MLFCYPFNSLMAKKKPQKKNKRRDFFAEKKKEDTVDAIVLEALPNALFKVELDGEEKLSFLSGKMRKFRIKVLVGDRVALVVDPYGGKARIVRRF